MAYTRTVWADGAAGGTPLDAAALNNLEQGMSDHDSALATRLNFRGVWTAGVAYGLYDVVNVGKALFYCTIAHTAANPAPTGNGNSYWSPVGAVLGTTTGTAADAGTLAAHMSDATNPHAVTKAQVGLGNVLNVQVVVIEATDTAPPAGTPDNTVVVKKNS